VAGREIAFGILCALACFSCSESASISALAVSNAQRAAAGAALLPFVQSAALEFSKQEPALETIVREARSTQAIQSLIDADLELAFTSRPVHASEIADAENKGRRLHMVVIAAEAVAVVVHPQNPLDDISAEALKAVFFSGAIRDWAELTGGKKHGPIHVLGVNPKTSGTGDLFVSTIAGDDKPKYLAGAAITDYSDDTVSKVAADPDAISFSGMGNVGASVKAVTINAVQPTEKTILDTSYVLNRKLFVITEGAPKKGRRDFIKFLLGERGQRIARSEGITPIVLD
jgi:phosphate transport system substrate-binding protein